VLCLMSSKPSSSAKEKLIDGEEEVLQAVILADSFNKRFRPLTTRKPRVRDMTILLAFNSQTSTSVSTPNLQCPSARLDIRGSRPRWCSGSLCNLSIPCESCEKSDFVRHSSLLPKFLSRSFLFLLGTRNGPNPALA